MMSQQNIMTYDPSCHGPASNYYGYFSTQTCTQGNWKEDEIIANWQENSTPTGQNQANLLFVFLDNGKTWYSAFEIY